jgi:hypothetical protein
MRLRVHVAYIVAALALVSVSVPAAAAVRHPAQSERPHPAATGEWKTMPPPAGVVQPAALDDIVAAGPRQAWAVGAEDLSHGGRPLLLSWNGRRWTKDALASGMRTGAVSQVSTTAPGTAWAFGYSVSGATFIVRWTGHRWVRVRAPRPLRGNMIYSVAAGTDGSAWVYGYTDSNGYLLERWSGRSWQQIKVPDKLGGDATEMVATGPRDVWLSDETNSGANVMARYHAGSWSSIKAQEGLRFMTGFLPVTPRNVWVSGWLCTDIVIGEGCNASRAYISHWNGSAWSTVQHLGHQFTGTTSISAGRTGQALWAGMSATGTDEPLLYQNFNGKTWSQVPGSRHTHGIAATNTMVAGVPGTNATWSIADEQAVVSVIGVTVIQYHAGS